MNVEDKLVNILINKGYHIAFAESCTSGLAVARIVNVANASKVLNCIFITYSNDAKINLVNVNPDTLDRYGAVSEEIVRRNGKWSCKSSKGGNWCWYLWDSRSFGWLKRKTNRNGLLWNTNKQYELYVY